LRSDDRGILGMPIKLAVIMLVIALTVPMVMDATEDAGRSLSYEGPVREAQSLADAASRAYYGGHGAATTADLSLPAGASIRIGGEGSDAYFLTVMKDGAVLKRMMMDHPAFPFLGGPIEVSGHCRVSLKCVIEDGVCGIRASA